MQLKIFDRMGTVGAAAVELAEELRSLDVSNPEAPEPPGSASAVARSSRA
jgi:hypothetical protein